MGSQIFRKISLERLSSPEQLDSLLTVTSPRSWIALSALAFLVIAALAWGILGSLSTKVNVQGILMESGGIQPVTAWYSGRITDVRVLPNDRVNKGEVIARMAQPDLVNQILDAQTQLKSLQVAGGDSAEIQALKSNIQTLVNKLKLSTQVVSPYTGRVVEVEAAVGDYANPGQPIVTIEPSGVQINDLEAIFYVPIEQSKQISPGMEVSIAPTSVQKEQYGLLKGRVISVSEYPATQQGMMKMLGNQELVQQLAGSGAPVEVVVDLIPDDNTISGYQWSTPAGPPVKLQSGTLALGSITIKKQRPLALIFPQLG